MSQHDHTKPDSPSSGSASSLQQSGPLEADVTFEQALGQLQEVVHRLNQPELSLDEALKIYERGVKLAHHGRVLLSQAERHFESLRTNLGDGDEPSS